MTGADYIAKVRLSNPEDDTLANPGETCERVPEKSLGWLLEQGLIEQVNAPAPAEPPQGEGERVTRRRRPASAE